MLGKKYNQNIILPNNYARTVVRIQEKGKRHLGNDLLIISPLKYNHQLNNSLKSAFALISFTIRVETIAKFNFPGIINHVAHLQIRLGFILTHSSHHRVHEHQ